MPVLSTSPGILLPFINELEIKLQEIMPLIQEWEDKKTGLYKTQEELETVKYRSTSALAQAGNANAEINNATVGVAATSPNKTNTLITNLRKEMMALAGSGEGGSIVLSTYTVGTIAERDALDVVIDGAICLVENGQQEDVGFEVYMLRTGRWIRISDEYTANVKQEITNLEGRIHKLESGLTIYEGPNEPEDKTVLWID